MKKIFTVYLILITVITQAQTISFKVTGNVAALQPLAKAYLVYRVNEQQVIDSTLVKNGFFQFNGIIDEPERAQLVISHDGTILAEIQKYDVLTFYLEKGTIKLTSADSIYKAAISAADVNEAYKDLDRLLISVNSRKKALSKEFMALSVEKQQSKDVQQDFQQRNLDIINEKSKILLTYVQLNHHTIVSLDALEEYANQSTDQIQLQALFDALTPDVKTTKSGIKFGFYLGKLKNTSVGAIAPDFTQQDPVGKAFKLSSFRGKYLLLDFWASWCGPCRAENPNVVEAYKKYHDKGFDVLGVSLDKATGKENWINAIHKDGLIWTQVSDLKFWDNEAAVLYLIKSIPQNFLLDPSGKIIAKDLRGDELNTKLAELFK